MEAIEKVTCYLCNKEFYRKTKELKRNRAKNQKIFCSRKCQCKVTYSNLYDENGKKRGRIYIPKRPLDEFSPFRYHLKNARQHSKKKNRQCTITLSDLKNQWEKQNGICPYTGWSLYNTKSQHEYNVYSQKQIFRASLDRIDSSKGYTPDNI